MRMPDVSTSPRRLVQFLGLFLLARLEAHADLGSLAALWMKVLDALKAAIRFAEEALERRIRTRAALQYSDARFDDVVRTVAAAGKADNSGRSDGPEWSRLFPAPFGKVVRLPIPREIEEAKLLEAELSSNPFWRSAKEHLPALKTAREGLEKAYADHRAAVAASVGPYRQLHAVAEQWRTEYRAIFGALTQRFPRDRRLVQSFLWGPKDVRSEEEPPTPTQPSAVA